MSSLFNNKQQKMANKYSKYMSRAMEQGESFAIDVLNSLSPETINDSFETISNKGHGYEKDLVTPIAENYKNNKKLSADELIQLNDVFISVTKRLEANGDDFDE